MDAFRQLYETIAQSSEMGPFLVLGILVLSGFAGGWVARLVRLPKETGNIVGGLLVGPACLGLIGTHGQLEALQPLATFAVSLVAVSIGGHLSYRRIHNALRRILFISFFEVGCTFFLVLGAARLFGLAWPVALLLSAVSASTAPATTISLIREMRAKGSFVKTLASAVALNNILAILLFVMMKTFVSAYFETGKPVVHLDAALLLSAYHLLGALAIGLAAGWVSKTLVALPRFHDFSTVLMAIVLCDGLATYLGLSPLLTNLFFGVFLGNSTRVAEKQLTTLVPLEPVLYVFFFALAGLSLHLDALHAVGLLALAYAGARMLGKSLGAVLGGLAGRCSPRIWKNMAIALFPQSGVAVGLVLMLGGDAFIPGSVSQAVGAIVLAGVVLAEIAGPFFTRAALVRSGEAGRDRQRLVEFLAEEFVLVDMKAVDKWDAIRQLVAFLMRTHRVEHVTEEELYQSVVEREKMASTAMGRGIAIPHGRIDEGPAIQGVMGICREGVDFDAPDGEPVRLIMLIVTPEDKKHLHLKVLASLSAMVRDETIRTRLMAAISPEDAMEVIEGREARDYDYFLEADDA